MKRTLVFLMVLAIIVSMLAAVPFAASADDGSGEAAPVWSGKANIKWYVDALAEDPDATEFHLATAEDLAGLSYLVNAYSDKDRKTCYDGLYYDVATGEVLGFCSSGVDKGGPFKYEKLGFYIPRPQQEGLTDGYTTTEGIYRQLYSDVTDEVIDGSDWVAGNQFYGKTIYLDTDLVMNEGTAQDFENEKPANAWMPIGGGRDIDAVFSSFIGTFKGQGHTISGLYLSDPDTADEINKVGLFGHLARGGTVTLQDIVLENCYFEGYREIGGFVGRTNGSVMLFNCHIKNSIIKGVGEVGGIAGSVHEGAITMEECSVLNVKVEGQKTVGAFAGGVDWKPISVTNSIATGTVRAYTVTNAGGTTGGWDVGIIVGRIAGGSISVDHVISSVNLIQEADNYQNEKASYTASCGVVYGAVSKKDNTTYNDAPSSVVIEAYYYVEKIQANGHIVDFPNAEKVENESDLTGTRIDRYGYDLDFENVWVHGDTGELPYLKNAGHSTDENAGGGDTPPVDEIDHVTKHEFAILTYVKNCAIIQ